jgi:hypothetical protein
MMMTVSGEALGGFGGLQPIHALHFQIEQHQIDRGLAQISGRLTAVCL